MNSMNDLFGSFNQAQSQMQNNSVDNGGFGLFPDFGNVAQNQAQSQSNSVNNLGNFFDGYGGFNANQAQSQM